MRPAKIALLVAALLASGVAIAPAQAKGAQEVAGVALPARSRPMPEGRFIAAAGFKKTVVYFERYLRSRGLAHQQLPVIEVRGVLLSRFLSDDKGSAWAAIHVYQLAGVTSIFIVARPAEPAPDEKPRRP